MGKFNQRFDKIMSELREATQPLEELRDDMQSEYDDKSEKWQEGEKGEALQQAIDDLDQFISDIQEIDTPQSMEEV